MPFDFKREYKRLYQPGREPALVEVPPMRFAAVEGSGDPNDENGPYQAAVAVLYAVSYALKMSKLGSRTIEGYFDFVVPPLEGFWWQNGAGTMDYADKAGFHWLSAIRLPDFVTPADFDWAVDEASRKKKLDCSPARLVSIHEGLCVQLTHVGPYDDEPASVARMEAFIGQNGLVTDFSDQRRHHEIYLTDPRRTAPEKLRTVIRHPVRRV